MVIRHDPARTRGKDDDSSPTIYLLQVRTITLTLAGDIIFQTPRGGKPAAVACFRASSIVMPLAIFGELRGLRVVSVRCTCVVPRVCQKHLLNKISFGCHFGCHFVVK